MLLLLLIAVPLAGGLLADAMFGYFLAVRQFLWVLPAVAILAASAWEARPREAAALVLLAVLVCGYKGARYFTQPEPDWAAAANAIASEVDRGACFRVTPEIARGLYAYGAARHNTNSTPETATHDRPGGAAILPSSADSTTRLSSSDERLRTLHDPYAGGTFVAVHRIY